MKKYTTLEMQRLTVEEYRKAEKLPLTIVLDNVRSLHNVGSVFRSADTFRAERLCLCGITACPPMPEIHKTALGAEDSVEWKHYASATECVEELHRQGYVVFAVEQCHGSMMLNEFSIKDFLAKQGKPVNTPIAVILGNEVHGVTQEAIDMCDGCLEIPQLGTKHSLNVSVTAGIIIWEFARQMIL